MLSQVSNVVQNRQFDWRAGIVRAETIGRQLGKTLPYFGYPVIIYDISGDVLVSLQSEEFQNPSY